MRFQSVGTFISFNPHVKAWNLAVNFHCINPLQFQCSIGQVFLLVYYRMICTLSVRKIEQTFLNTNPENAEFNLKNKTADKTYKEYKTLLVSNWTIFEVLIV